MVKSIYQRMALDVAERSLFLLRERHSYITSNIANADTPFYKAKRFTFEKQLQEAVYGSDKLPLKLTDEKHISNVAYSIDDVTGTVFEERYLLRNDGNSVDIDKEMAYLAENQLKFTALTQFYSMQLAKLKYAIGEGRGA